jgi:septum formation protein
MEIILASASPRRKELLKQIGLEFIVFPAQGEEVSDKIAPRDIVVELAQKKAGEIYEKTIAAGVGRQDSIVIGADTIVVFEETILGKPKDEQDAIRMLTMLSGKTHEVYTGVSLWMRENGNKVQYSFYEKTEVTMYPIKQGEIVTYVKGGEPMDKAGSYGIQGQGARFIQKINGDYNNVVGLPVGRIYQELTQLGIAISGNSL